MEINKKTPREALATCRQFLEILNEDPEKFGKVIANLQATEERLKDALAARELKDSWRT